MDASFLYIIGGRNHTSCFSIRCNQLFKYVGFIIITSVWKYVLAFVEVITQRALSKI